MDKRWPNNALSLRYINDFSCIGPQCEDTCCAGSQIPIAKQDYDRIEQALSSLPKSVPSPLVQISSRSPQLQAGVEPAYATLALTETGNCRLLTTDRLCELQQEFGETILPTTCANYPRRIQLIDDELEVSGHLSCPEVARNFVHGDSALDVDQRNSDWLPRQVSEQTIPSPGHGVFEEHAGFMRQLFMSVLGATDDPFPMRLFAFHAFTSRTSEYFDRTTSEGSIATLRFDVERLEDERHWKNLRSDFKSYVIGHELYAKLMRSMLMDTLLSGPPPRFRALVSEVLCSVAGVQTLSDALKLDGKAWAKATESALSNSMEFANDKEFMDFARRWALDRVFTHLIVHNENLRDYSLDLLVQLSVMHFLYRLHPTLRDGSAKWNEVCVYVLSSTQSALGHQPQVATRLRTHLLNPPFTAKSAAAALLCGLRDDVCSTTRPIDHATRSMRTTG